MAQTALRPAPSERDRRSPARRRRAWVRRRVRWARHHKLLSVFLVVVMALTPVWVSLGSALADPGNGSSVPARFAEWMRLHGGRSIVDWAENLWYSHHPPPVGGKPAKGAIPPPPNVGHAPSQAALATVVHLAAPAPIVPIASPPIPGEGQWHPVGRLVHGLPAVYEAYLRPDAVHTSVVVGVAWMDTKLLSATLYSGSTIPGGGPWADTAPVSDQAATTLVAAFNAGFLMRDADGGYYSEDKMMAPLRDGAASFVVYRNGTATVADWGRDAVMTPDVVSVMQNVNLLVDNGRPVPGLNANDTTKWGYTLGNQVYVWRSGLGVTADGALVYVGGPDMNITDMANVLVQAGAVRAMELDINTDWVNLSTYDPSTSYGAANAANGSELVSSMTGTPGRYFESWWSRDFITMSATTGTG